MDKHPKFGHELWKCIWCGGKAIEFRDHLSVKEYHISGLCQKCQDKVFGEGVNG